MGRKGHKYNGNKYKVFSLKDRFWDKVNKKTDEECWEWNTYLTDGYGKIWSDRKMVHSHRISWMLHFGEIPDGVCVLHKCDNRACVNPNHLFLGTNDDNMKDRNNKNRQAKGVTNRHKLSEKDVLEIRRLYSTGEFFQTTLGRMFKVSTTQIRMIVYNRSWSWLK